MGEKQMKKSKIIIITIITILVFVAIAMYLWKRNENSYKIEKVTNIKYNLILENIGEINPSRLMANKIRVRP